MKSVKDDQRGAARRRRLDRELRASLRDVTVQLSLLNHQVRGHLELKGTDLECLDLISREGPLSPSALARRRTAASSPGKVQLRAPSMNSQGTRP